MFKTAVIGYGERLPEQTELLESVGSCELSGVLAVTPTPSEWDFPQEKQFQTIDALLDISDIIILLASKEHSFDDLAYIIKHSSNVYLKKTGHLSIAQKQKLNMLANEANCRIQVGNALLYRKLSQEIISEVQHPCIIDGCSSYPLIKSPRFNISLSALMRPEIGFINTISGGTPRKIRVSAIQTTKSRQVDIISLRLEYDNGCSANLTASSIPFDTCHHYKIFGKEFMLFADYIGNFLNIKRKKSTSIEPSDNLQHRVLEFDAFYNAVANNTTPAYTLSDDIEVSKVIEEIDSGLKHAI